MSYPYHHPQGGPPLPFVPPPPLFASAARAGRNETPGNGTGYGGDAQADTAKRQAGRKLAQKNQDDVAKIQRTELETVNKCIAMNMNMNHIDIDTPPPISDAVLDTLKRVLRNSADWSNRHRRQLYQAALCSCQLLLQHHPRQLGQRDQDDSVLAALDELAQTCAVFLKHAHHSSSSFSSRNDNSNDNDALSQPQPQQQQQQQQASHIALAQRALEIRDDALHMAKRLYEAPELAMIDPHEQYRHELRRHAFDFVPTLVHHAYDKQTQQTATATATANSLMPQKTLIQELTTYATSLPIDYGSSILVRAKEGNMNQLRVLIFGPDETPYANGCFVFDVLLEDYPNKPPVVKFLTTGGGKYRFNPNLYKDGKVCLSLLGTWSGPGWQRGESTLLQVLVSIQSLILVDDPYFNEPGYQSSRGTVVGTTKSQHYNAHIRQYTMTAAILPFLQSGGPYPEFRDAVLQHYELKRFVLQQQWKQWLAQDSLLSLLLLQPLQSQFLAANQKTISHPSSSTLKRKAKSVATAATARARPSSLSSGVGGVIHIDDEAARGRPSSLPSGVMGVIHIDGDDDDDDDDDKGDNQSKPPGRPRRPKAKARHPFTNNNEVVDLT